METFKLLSGKRLHIEPSEINCIMNSRNTIYLHSCKNAFSLAENFEYLIEKLGFYEIEKYLINLAQIGCIEEMNGYFLIYFKNSNVISVDSEDILTAWQLYKGLNK